jgi:hypothetical protein
VLVDFLRANTDIFAWSPSDMPGIPREITAHSLDILPHSRAMQQRLHRFDEERRRAIGVELRKVLEAGFIKEVFQPMKRPGFPRTEPRILAPRWLSQEGYHVQSLSQRFQNPYRKITTAV